VSGILGLENKVVLVTGAAAGIGAATAELFAQEGAVLALCDRSAEFGESDDPFRRTFDVRDSGALTAFVDGAAQRFGRIDVVVNNAGGTFAAPLLDVSAKGEAALIAENFTQVTQLLRASVPHIERGGCIVNVTSIEAHRAAPAFAVYAAMKAAQANLTQSLALELAPRGIRVNAMAPDVLATEGIGSLGGRDASGADADADGRIYRTPTVPPLGHWGTARDGAGAIAFLASDLARFVTGVTLHVDGGNLAAGGWHRADVEIGD
jgi:3-oxoacyl-[acyl-carrier protein] reductase